MYSLDPVRKGLGNNLAHNCLAGIPRFLNSANFLLQIFTVIGKVYYSNFQDFYVLPYYLLPVIKLNLNLVMFFPHQH